MINHDELVCLKDYLTLPKNLDVQEVTQSIDIGEQFYIPTSGYYSHETSFKARHGQDSFRAFIAKSNVIMAIIDGQSRKLVAESKSQEEGDAQLIVATNLQDDHEYILLIEFSALTSTLDGSAQENCNHFYMSMSTWDSKNICSTAIDEPQMNEVTVTSDSAPQKFSVPLTQKFIKKELRVEGSNPVDLQFTVDHSDAFFRAELSIKAVLI